MKSDLFSPQRTRTRRTRTAAAATILVAVSLAACGGGGSSPPPTPLPSPSSTPTPVASPPSLASAVVGVSGASLTVNGVAYEPRSVVIRGFTAPAAYEAAHEPVAAEGRKVYGPTELAAAHAFGADTLRFLISQPGLDPTSTIYDPNYLPSIQSAVTQARQSGFLVVLAMQDESPSGDPNPHLMPIATTQSDWDELAPIFGHDRGIIFELYNEPGLPQTAANWQIWLDGGAVGADTAIGMQPMIDHLRAESVQNVFLLDGLNYAQMLDGLPPVTDPLGRLAYGVHPYFAGHAPNESLWDPDFGIPSRSVPVFADEWAAQSDTSLGFGNSSSFQPAVDFVNYLRSHKIALGGAGFDAPGFMVQGVPGWTPTNYDNFSSTSTADDAGLLISNDFLANYSRPLTDADAVTH